MSYVKLVGCLTVALLLTGCAITTVKTKTLPEMSDEELLSEYYKTNDKIVSCDRRADNYMTQRSFGIGEAMAQGLMAGSYSANANTLRQKKVAIVLEMRRRNFSSGEIALPPAVNAAPQSRVEPPQVPYQANRPQARPDYGTPAAYGTQPKPVVQTMEASPPARPTVYKITAIPSPMSPDINQSPAREKDWVEED